MGNELAAQVSRMDAFLDKLIELCTTAGVKILIAILIYIVGKFIIGKLMKMVDKMHSVSRLDDTAKRDRKSTRLNSSHRSLSRMPSSA